MGAILAASRHIGVAILLSPNEPMTHVTGTTATAQFDRHHVIANRAWNTCSSRGKWRTAGTADRVHTPPR